jgi:hypothetical protein
MVLLSSSITNLERMGMHTVTNFPYLITLCHLDSVLLIADALSHPQLVLVINKVGIVPSAHMFHF